MLPAELYATPSKTYKWTVSRLYSLKFLYVAKVLKET